GPGALACSIASYSLSLSVMTSFIRSPEYGYPCLRNYRKPSYNYLRSATFLQALRIGEIE
ncbi:hypothetical protein NE662_10305, partial [Bifidobacterium pseudocatenulatum]|uniref:hypothetical protein n=1 Tax=Bifidobacterium pseudocatenulatum TaxID=28026 RepID=UPI00210E46C2